MGCPARGGAFRVSNPELFRTGLGDRLAFLLGLAALGDSLDCLIRVPFAQPRLVDKQSVPLALFNASFWREELVLPPTLVLEDREAGSTTIGGALPDGVPDAAPLRASRAPVPQASFHDYARQVPGLDREQFLAAHARSAAQLRPRRPAALHRPYVALHLRRVFAGGNAADTEEDVEKLLGHADLLLGEALSLLEPRRLNATVLLLGDEPTSLQKWRRKLQEKGVLVLSRPPLVGRDAQARMAVRDFFDVMRSCGVVASVPFRQGWSSFSAVPALSTRRPYLAVFDAAMSLLPFRFTELEQQSGGRVPFVWSPPRSGDRRARLACSKGALWGEGHRAS